jgi:hypothetical protein
MRSIDERAIRDIVPQWSKVQLKDTQSIALLSPGPDEISLVEEVLPGREITKLSVGDWSLDDVLCRRFDLVWAANIFMASPDPMRWFRNVWRTCRHFVLLDHILAWRAGERECALDDGDVMRFCYPPDHVARVDWAFDLHQIDDQILNMHVFDQPQPVHPGKSFILLSRGDVP